MAIYANVSGADKSTTPYVNVAGTWKPVQTAYVNVSGTWKTTYTLAISASLTPTTLYGACNSSELSTYCNAVTGSVTATPANGTAPFSYAWELVYGDSFTIVNPTSSTTTFELSDTPIKSKSGTYRCLVTDADGASGYTDYVTVSMDFTLI